MNLAINRPGDEYEKEADRVAEQVMQAPRPRSQSACACGERCPGCQTEQSGRAPQRFPAKRSQPGDTARSEVPPIVGEVIGTPGRALDSGARAFMEPRFGRSFADIRVHTDGRSAESARAIGARAYTWEQHIVFAAGEYAPNTDPGRRLLAHELVHTLQQGAATPAPCIQRQGDSPPSTGPAADRANDPNFLTCLVLCELGIPPSLWRTVLNEILSAVNREYRDRLGDLRGSEAFESFRAELAVMSTFNVLRLIVGFLGESRIGPLVIERPAAQAIRRALLARLAERGLQSATLEVASQILRRVALAIEVAIAAGCLTYCGAMTAVNALLDFSSAALGAISSFVNAASEVGAALGAAIARPILVARASMDPSNWDLSALPDRSRAHMNVIGLAFRLAFSPDAFLASMARPLNSYNISAVLGELAQDINTALRARGGFAQFVTFTADFIGGLSPLQLVQILRDYGLLRFVQDPEVLADQQLSARP